MIMPTTPTNLEHVTHVTKPSSSASQGPFCNIRLSSAHQEGIFNSFNGYKMQSPVPRGEDLVEQIREDLEPRELVDPMVTVNYEIYKKL